MDFGSKIRLLDKPANKMFRCGHCSHLAPSYNPNFGFCPFCELYTDKADDDLGRGQQALLGEIYSSLSSGKFPEAAASFDKMLSSQRSPQNLYAAAVFYTLYSDYEYSKREYTAPRGFMEDNAISTSSGLEMYSKAKLLLYQSISLCDKTPKEQRDALLYYTKFLAYTRLKKKLEASRALAELLQNDNQRFMTEYASMIHHCSMADKLAEPSIAKVIDLGIPNAFYYAANLLAEHRKFREAKELAAKLLQKVDMHYAKQLLVGIERVQARL
ncbi:MAG: hypothetical protein KGH61_03890 [Candidatus Micrarchaeota archaeon]|nr:hypothetical protein [Candidatus Micrarchaeota archaeon]MDE1848063.1 hypothetical protein [Candidatus Micrarchaeota archaeon]MDE1864619.1 hypothetical protein [Candidatus Micrarchaeota archaeon]